MKQYICIDIGGTEIKYGIMDETELFLAKDKTPTEASKGGPCLVEKAAGTAGEYLNSGLCGHENQGQDGIRVRPSV